MGPTLLLELATTFHLESINFHITACSHSSSIGASFSNVVVRWVKVVIKTPVSLTDLPSLQAAL
jgi:hypothetical protein